MLKKLIGVAAVAGIIVAAVVFGGEPKVTICHIPQGNPTNMQTITIGQSAVAKHLANHKTTVGDVTYQDYVGRCRNPIALEDVCGTIIDIARSGVTEESVTAASELTYDLQPELARVSPDITGLYFNADADTQAKAQASVVNRVSRAGCSSFCDAKALPTVSDTLSTSTSVSGTTATALPVFSGCSSSTYVGTFEAATADALGISVPGPVPPIIPVPPITPVPAITPPSSI